MQQFFLKTMSQKCGRYVCLQLLQTLSILYENIRNETSICESKKGGQLGVMIARFEGFMFSFRLPFVQQPCELPDSSEAGFFR